MGMICPECGKRSPVKSVITADGQGARKAEDVIAFRLECGHTVGGEAYNDFVKQCREIDVGTQRRMNTINEAAQSRKAAIWRTISEDEKGDEDNAE